jgi:hypothetical protein
MTDIVVHQKFERAPPLVARVMFDPANEPRWIDGAKRVEPYAQSATEIGARGRRHGSFWGQSFTWTTETTAFEPDRKLVLHYVEGPMTGDVTYEIAPDGAGAKVTIRHQGATLAMPGAEMFLKRKLQADLKRLKTLVERQPKT